jgi:AraC-like DNA-binding protein
MSIDADFAIAQRFESSYMDELMADLSHWDTDFQQLNTATDPSWALQIISPDLIYSEALFSCGTDQRGATPPGYRSFALLGPESSVSIWNNHLFEHDAIVIKPRDNAFHATATANLHVRTFSLKEDTLAEIAEQYFEYDWYKTITDTGSVFTLPPVARGRLLRLLQQLTLLGNQLSALPPNPAGPEISRSQITLLRDSISQELVASLQNASDVRRVLPRHRYRSLVAAIEYIKQNPSAKLSIRTLCQQSNCSVRTLEYAFRQAYSMTPKRYLLTHQLNRVCRALRASDYADNSITEIAADWGFTHPGQFAKDYYSLYGELPRQPFRRDYGDSLLNS